MRQPSTPDNRQAADNSKTLGLGDQLGGQQLLGQKKASAVCVKSLGEVSEMFLQVL